MDKRTIKIYCPTHRIGFTTAAAEMVMCEDGGHVLADDFPRGEFWEYCCDCQHYWPSGVGSGAPGRERCPLCERPAGMRYVCDYCKVQSYDSGEAVGRKVYSISADGVIQPACAGCLRRPRSQPRPHLCRDSLFAFTTARDVCPFCEETIAAPTAIADAALPAVVEKTNAGWASSAGGQLVVSPAAAFDQPAAPPRTHTAPLPLAPAEGLQSPTPQPAAEPDAPTAPAADAPAKSAAPGKLLRAVAVVVCAAVVLALFIAVASRAGESLEKQLDQAMAAGQLFHPPGASAFDLYRRLRNEGATPAVIARYDERLWPPLTTGPQQLLAEFARPGTDEPSLSRWEDAHQRLSWASQIRPDDGVVAARAAYCEGRIAYLNNRKAEALEAWKRASALDGSWPLPVNGVGLIHNEHRQYETARTFLREAVRRDPNWAVPYNNLGTSYYYQRMYEEAATYYAKAAELAPTWGRPHAWLGDIARYRGDYARAAQEYEFVLAPTTVGTSKMDLGEIRQRLKEVRRLSGLDTP